MTLSNQSYQLMDNLGIMASVFRKTCDEHIFHLFTSLIHISHYFIMKFFSNAIN